VRIDILGHSGEWVIVGTAITDANGVFSLPFQAAYDVGEYSIRISYAGGKIGPVWYSSSNAVLQLRVDPGRIMMSISCPTVSTADRITLALSVNDVKGRPLRGVVVEVYLDGKPSGRTTTDDDETALIVLGLGLADLGSHTITARASLRNYAAEQASRSITVIFPLWIIILIMTAAIGMAVMLGRRAYRRYRESAE
jgi:hypothetical protein